MTEWNRIAIQNKWSANTPNTSAVMDALLRVPYRTPEQEWLISLPRHSCSVCGKINFWNGCQCQDEEVA